MQEKRKVTQEGYAKLQEKVKKLERIRIECAKELAATIRANIERLDPAIILARTELKRSEDALRQAKEILKMVEIVDSIDYEENMSVAEIGDLVDLELRYDDEEENISVILTDVVEKDDEVSINSPMGKAIYHKPVGTVAEYSINGQYQNQVKILGITKQKDLVQTRK